MSAEWDNLRAAHLWSSAQRDLDLAERLAEGSFLFSVFSMRHEHAAMLKRTVQLGDECGRPSTTMLGMLSDWMEYQGSPDEATRLAQRGLDAAPSPIIPRRRAAGSRSPAPSRVKWGVAMRSLRRDRPRCSPLSTIRPQRSPVSRISTSTGTL